MKKPHCPKNHRFRPISFNEKTGAAVYACKCGIQWKRQAKFVCRELERSTSESVENHYDADFNIGVYIDQD